MPKNSPLQQVNKAHGSKDQLVARIARGKATSFYRSPRGWHPVGVAATHHDGVYVLEYGRGVRVAFVDPQGRARPLLELAG